MCISEITNKAAICFAVVVAAISTAHAGTEYLFHVSCPDKQLVAQWNTGDIDPGQEYLRVATGMKYSGCSISDYSGQSDANLPRERFSHEGAIIQGIPVVGTIICGLFGC